MTASSPREQLKSELESWVDKFGIRPFVEKNIRTVATWVDLCSPHGASADNRLLASKELLVVFYSLDDFEGEDWEAYYDDCLRILMRYELRSKSRYERLLVAYAHTIAEMESRGHDTFYYRRGRIDLISEYRWKRNSPRRGSLTRAEHLDRRRVTIYTQQWTDMWEILEAAHLTHDARRSLLVRDALESMILWQIFQNELCSRTRDRESGESNLVDITHNDTKRAANTVGANTVWDSRDKARSRLNLALQRLRVEAIENSLVPVRYVEILEDCLQGTVENYGQNLERYDLDRSLLAGEVRAETPSVY
ncbi:MAG: hypothetical protein AB1Z98_28120 [Nannocystaceae bacterium]